MANQTLDIQTIFIEFNESMYQTFTEKVGDNRPHKESIQYIENNNKALAEILAYSISLNIPASITQAWVENLKLKISSIPPNEHMSFYGDMRKETQEQIEEFLASYRSYFSLYQTHFLPLEEKIQLEQNITSMDSNHTNAQKLEKKSQKI